MEEAARAIDALWSGGDERQYPFEQTESSYRDHCRSTARAALEAALSAPEGWQLVPVEPITAMLNAAIDTDRFKLGDISPLGFRISPQQMFERCWHAMLSATPLPPGEA
jgi:hypothetical protein